MEIILKILALMVAVTIHEVMHGWTANYLGDPTAKRAGRITLNPVAHIDLFGTILLPLLLILANIPPIGWAKPVPINPNNFNNPRLGSALTAVAGPISNFLIAVAAAGLFRVFSGVNIYLTLFLGYLILVNLFLMIFNLLPVPPLDGSKFFALFFPILDNPKLEIYGPVILIAIIYLFNGARLLLPAVEFLATKVLGVGILF